MFFEYCGGFKKFLEKKSIKLKFNLFVYKFQVFICKTETALKETLD